MKRWRDAIGKVVIVRVGKNLSDVFGAVVEDVKDDRVLLDILDLYGFPTGKSKWYNIDEITLLEVLE